VDGLGGQTSGASAEGHQRAGAEVIKEMKGREGDERRRIGAGEVAKVGRRRRRERICILYHDRCYSSASHAPCRRQPRRDTRSPTSSSPTPAACLRRRACPLAPPPSPPLVRASPTGAIYDYEILLERFSRLGLRSTISLKWNKISKNDSFGIHAFRRILVVALSKAATNMQLRCNHVSKFFRFLDRDLTVDVNQCRC
jgi:hypothetical protein